MNPTENTTELYEEEKRANAIAQEAARLSASESPGVPWKQDLNGIVALWPQARIELFSLAASLRQNGAGITYSQLMLAIRMADQYYRPLKTIDRLSEKR